MPKQSLNMRKIYVGSLITSILVGFYLFDLHLNAIPQQVLMWVAFIPFLLFVFGVVGLVVSYQMKDRHGFFWWILFPLLVGALFYGLFFVHMFVLEPHLCPCLQP